MKNRFYSALVFAALACALLLSSSNAYAQDQKKDATASIVSYWKEGDTKRFTVRKTKEKDVNGKLSKETVSQDVTLRVLDEDENSYTVEWTYENTTAQVGNPLIERLYATSNGLRVIYRTDELGVFTELLNWKEIQEHLYKALDMAEKQVEDNQAAKSVFSQFKAIYSTRESIESMLKDINIYHSPYGSEYTLNEKITAETQLPNMLGGSPLPAKVEVQMTELKPELDYCKIVTKQRIDREKATQMVYEFLKRTSEQSGKPLPKDFEMPVLNVDDTSEHEIELAKGWVKKAYHKRELQSGPARQIDTYEINMLK